MEGHREGLMSAVEMEGCMERKTNGGMEDQGMNEWSNGGIN